MDKGQHIRLVIVTGTSQSPTNKVIALATDLAFHLSAQMENSTTKDTSDGSGAVWDEQEITGRTGDIQFGALIGSGTDASAEALNDIMTSVDDTLINWKIVMTSGASNRTIGKTICSGQGKVTSLNPQGQNRQNAQYSGTITLYGPVTVGSD